MASGTSYWTMMASYTTGLTPEDVNEGVALVAKSVPLLARIGVAGFVANSTTHQYTEQTTRVARTTVASAATAAETSLSFADAVFAAGEYVRVGTEVI